MQIVAVVNWIVIKFRVYCLICSLCGMVTLLQRLYLYLFFHFLWWCVICILLFYLHEFAGQWLSDSCGFLFSFFLWSLMRVSSLPTPRDLTLGAEANAPVGILEVSFFGRQWSRTTRLSDRTGSERCRTLDWTMSSRQPIPSKRALTSIMLVVDLILWPIAGVVFLITNLARLSCSM